MNILRLYKAMVNSQVIGGMSPKELEEYIDNNKVIVKNSLLLIKEKGIAIHCAATYYTNKYADHKKTIKDHATCFTAMKYLTQGLKTSTYIRQYDCLKCHKWCINSEHLTLPMKDCREELEELDKKITNNNK